MSVHSAEIDDVESIVEALRRSVGGPIVFTNGVFDILHSGHIACLESARALGGGLVVAINSDDSVRQLGKGPERPLIGELSRATVIAAMRAVDEVFIFETVKPIDILRRVHPDIYVKGGDYDVRALEETSIIEEWGGHAVAIPITCNESTTRIVERIRAVSKTR